jgi:hypothetical protein
VKIDQVKFLSPGFSAATLVRIALTRPREHATKLTLLSARQAASGKETNKHAF